MLWDLASEKLPWVFGFSAFRFEDVGLGAQGPMVKFRVWGLQRLRIEEFRLCT